MCLVRFALTVATQQLVTSPTHHHYPPLLQLGTHLPVLPRKQGETPSLLTHVHVYLCMVVSRHISKGHQQSGGQLQSRGVS